MMIWWACEYSSSEVLTFEKGNQKYLSKWLKYKNSDNTKCWRRNWIAHTLLVGRKIGTVTLEKQFDSFLKIKLIMSLPYGPAAVLWGICSKEVKTCIHAKLAHECDSPTLETARTFFGERLSTSWYIRTMESYSAIKRNELWYTQQLGNLKGMMLSEKVSPKRLPAVWLYL